MNPQSNWSRVSQSDPCPVCRKEKWCTVSPDGFVVRCKRVPSDEKADGGDGEAWIHRIGGDGPVAPTRLAWPEDERTDNRWARMAAEFTLGLLPDRADALAQELRVGNGALVALGLGWDGERGRYTIPMYDAKGAICGLHWRSGKEKQSMSGSQLGVFRRLRPGEGMLLICEGASDTAAAISLGFDAIGVPGAGQGTDIATVYARGRDVVIVADKDEAGERGAAKLAKAVSATAQSVRTVVPPVKDLREWLICGATRQVVEDAIAATAGEACRGQPALRSWLEVANDPPVEWTVGGLVPVAGNVVLAGEPGSGKTLLALDMALARAHGLEWLGRPCQVGSTLYLAGEGTRGLGARVRAWLSAHPGVQPRDGHYVAISETVPNLTRAGAEAQLENLIAEATRKFGCVPDLIVIDTLAMAMPGADENDAGPVGVLMALLANIRHRQGCGSMILHHLRKPSTDRVNAGSHAVRGSSAIVGAADVVMIATVCGAVRKLSMTKARDGEILDPIAYEVVGQETGRLLPNCGPERGPIVRLAQVEEAARPDPLEVDVQRLVAAMQQLGGKAPNKAALNAQAKMKGERAVAAFAVAEERGWFVNLGTASRPDWRFGDSFPRSQP
jgi:hypothetical protein